MWCNFRAYFLAVSTLLVPWLATEASASPWVVVDLRGSAQLTSEGTRRSLHKGDELTPGSILSSDPGSRVAIFQDGNAVVLLGGSSVELPGPTGNSGLTRVIQKFGQVIFDITQRPNKHFQVDTPYLIAGVKGTRFAVTVDETQGELTVLEGIVEVSTSDGDDATDVLPGRSATVRQDTQGSVQVSQTPAADNQFWGRRTHLLDAVPEQAEAVEKTNSGSNGNGNSGSNGNGNSGSNGNGNSGSNGNGNSGSNGNGNSGSNGNGNSGSNGNGNSGSNGNGHSG
ncbi:MAG: FecR domain-containing protein, partial [Alphaproteobacteria bacterium]